VSASLDHPDGIGFPGVEQLVVEKAARRSVVIVEGCFIGGVGLERAAL
jgi:hypothetical protein